MNIEKNNIYILPRYVHAINAVVLVLFGLSGFLLNGSAIVVLYKNKRLQTQTNMFILGVALSDFTMSILGNPFASIASINGEWFLGTTACKWEGFCVYFLGLTNMYLLCTLSIYRYIVISWPLIAPRITRRVTGVVIAICVILGLFWSLAPFFGWGKYGIEGARTSCGVIWVKMDSPTIAYGITIFLLCFLLPLGIMIYCSVHIYFTVRHALSLEGVDQKTREYKRKMRKERKVARTIRLMIFVYWMTWTPYAVVFFWGAFGKPDQLPEWVQTFPAIFAKSSIVWDPLVYVFTNRYFRKAFYEILPCENLKNKLLYKEEKTIIPCTEEKEFSLEEMPTSISVIHPKRMYQIEPDLERDVRELEPVDELSNDENMPRE